MIITDVPKTWLSLRSALQGNIPARTFIFGLLNVHLAADYKKEIARYSRLFLWTDWQFYSPFQIFERQATHRDLEIAAGPFAAVDLSATAPLVGATEA